MGLEELLNKPTINKELVKKIKTHYDIKYYDYQWFTIFKNNDFDEVVLDKEYGIYLSDGCNIYPNGDIKQMIEV